MEMKDFEAYWADCLAQKEYAIYRTGEDGQPQFFGSIGGHDEAHAISKMAQYEEIDPKTLTASRAWPNSNF